MTTKVSQDLTDNHSTYLYLKRKTKKSNKIIEATCERTTEGFVVLEGSQVEIKDSPYLPASLKRNASEFNSFSGHSRWSSQGYEDC